MESLKIGACGYVRGKSWDLKGVSHIVQIIVSHNNASLRGLQFMYLQNGSLHTSEDIGFFDGNIFDTQFTFQSCNEYITRVEGISTADRPYGIEKLTIHTNFNIYAIFEAKDEPYAHNSKSFSFNFGGFNQFGGFHGTENSQGVNAIGVYFNYLKLTALPSGFLQPSQDQEDEDHVGFSTSCNLR